MCPKLSKIHKVIKSLIADDAESGIIIKNIPESFVGKAYKELLDFVSNDTSEVLVGLLLNTERVNLKKKANPEQNAEQKEAEPYKYNTPLLTPREDFIIPKHAKSILICANH